ncbi:MAG: 39S ribosomal protein L24, mitochondrial [Pycnora praestabilis]|nr:MAG: 39S ribosomal protein L24, mitochondrial [Pycnora praestabilis]
MSRIAHDHQKIPEYPYGPNLWYKQSNHGLYGGTRIQFGNTISERTEIKNRRKWSPNIRQKRLWSVALNRWLRIRVSTRVLRTIDKVGGLDEYLLGEKAARIKDLGMGGWMLRWRIMQTEAVKDRFREERRRLGLPEMVEEALRVDGRTLSAEELQGEIKGYDRELDENERMAAERANDGGDENLGMGFMEEEAALQKPQMSL